MKHNTRHISFEMSADQYKLVARLANRLPGKWSVSKLFTHLIERGLPSLEKKRKDGSLFELVETSVRNRPADAQNSHITIRFPGKLLDELEEQVQLLSGVADFSKVCEITLQIAIDEMREAGILRPEFF